MRVFHIIFEIEGAFYVISKPTVASWSFAKTDGGERSEGETVYIVEKSEHAFSCTCPAGQQGYRCKHARTILSASHFFNSAT